jgi:hypothetical protein
MAETPEQKARREIDSKLLAAGWLVQDRADIEILWHLALRIVLAIIPNHQDRLAAGRRSTHFLDRTRRRCAEQGNPSRRREKGKEGEEQEASA